MIHEPIGGLVLMMRHEDIGASSLEGKKDYITIILKTWMIFKK